MKSMLTSEPRKASHHVKKLMLLYGVIPELALVELQTELHLSFSPQYT
jgi:hypothetical protein